MIENHVIAGSATRPDPRKVLARGLYQLSPHCQRERPARAGTRENSRAPGAGGEMPAAHIEGGRGVSFPKARPGRPAGKIARAGASLPLAPRCLTFFHFQTPRRPCPKFF
jgi:hypothetical protein